MRHDRAGRIYHQQMPTSEATLATLRGFTNTLDDAAAAARRTGVAARKGQLFNCVRGQGRLTHDECLTRFLGGHPVCARDCGCSLGKMIVEKVKPATEEAMSYRDKYGDCACGKTGVKLDKHGRCYKCQEVIREAAKQERKARVLAPKAYAHAEPIVAVQGVQEPDACQGWPETDGTLVIDGMEFEVVPSGKSAGIVNPVVSFRGSAIAFSADAVRKYGLDKLTHMRLHKAVGAVCFEVLAEPGPNTRKLYRQSKGAATLACTIHRLKKIFPGLSGRQFPLEATERPGFFLARVG
jgi:hypothetical protein